MPGPDPTGRISWPTEFIRGLTWKRPVDVASTGDLDITAPGATIDGVTMALGYRVLVKDNTDASQNGIRIWKGASVDMPRAFDMDQSSDVSGVMADEEIAGSFVFVYAGTVNAGLVFRTTNLPGDTFDVDDITFVEWSPGGGGSAFVPTFLAPGETFTVPANRQALYAAPIDNEGLLVLDGLLIEVD